MFRAGFRAEYKMLTDLSDFTDENGSNHKGFLVKSDSLFSFEPHYSQKACLPDTNRAIRPQKMARGVKFRI